MRWNKKRKMRCPKCRRTWPKNRRPLPLPTDELEGAFQDLESVVDLRRTEDQAAPPVSPSRVRMTDTSKLLATIGMSSALAGGNAGAQDRTADLKANAALKMRNRPWYYQGERLLVAGLMGVVIVGLLTAFVVLLLS